jgi:catechol 2,3-dioxygenase-like lactoylglutathione lyase family enzyme
MAEQTPDALGGCAAPREPLPIAAVDGRTPQQIGLIVEDIDAALRMYAGVLGMGPWIGYTFDESTVQTLDYRGLGSFSMKIALCGSQPQVELVQPLTGPSIYHEWMETHRVGLHHVGYIVSSIDDGIAEMKERGYPLIQYGAGYGLDGDGAFAYFDTVSDLGMIVELIVPPQRRRLPEWTVESPMSGR